MTDRVLLVGLDFGTTTSCALVASATVACNSLSGRLELTDVREEYQSDQVFTPLLGDRLDQAKLAEYLDLWLKPVDPQRVLGGGAVITGLSAKKANAAALAGQIRARVKDAVIAIAEDPGLESWLAWMGNCDRLSRAAPDRMIINLDIGGGTTNLAAGRNGEVLSTGSLFVGARHVQLVPGSYRIARLSSYARSLLDQLGIRKDSGDQLSEQEVLAIVDWYVALLEDAVRGACDMRVDPVRAAHEQAPFRLPEETNRVASETTAITLSGGVGQLVYAHLSGEPWPATTAFGDLGIDLARRLAETPFWRAHLDALRPTTLGRATVYGLLRYNTQISGSTIYISDPRLLPLADLVVLGSVASDSSPADVERLIALADRTANGACLKVELRGPHLNAIRELAANLRRALTAPSSAARHPLVLLVQENLGKVLGQYLTDWGATPMPLIVIDEIQPRDVQFAHLGSLQQGVLPISFYGMNTSGEAT